MTNMNSQVEIVDANMNLAQAKVQYPLKKMILSGMLAGAFIALGGAASSTAAHAIENVGLARTVAGCIFPVGLMLILLVGGDLFTGNCLIYMAVMDGRVRLKEFFKNLAVIWFSNLLGAVFIDILLFFSGNLDYSNGLLGAYAIKVAVGKISINPFTGFISGILCNILVCGAILMAGAAKDVAGKIWAAFFPIFAFVVVGFEHCVANMFYIPMGMLAATNSKYVEMAEQHFGITAEKLAEFNVGNLITSFVPITIGNVVGGAICVGAVCYIIHKKFTANN